MIKYIKEGVDIKYAPMECINGATVLSKEEAESLLTKEQRRCKGTEEALAEGLWANGEGYSWYWLRTPGSDRLGNQEATSVCGVLPDGDICTSCEVDDRETGVRPALLLNNIRSSGFTIGDKFQFGDVTFVIISNKLALSDMIVFPFCFNTSSTEGNNYENSWLKHEVGSWFIQKKKKTMQDIQDNTNGIRTDIEEADLYDFGF